MCCIFTRQNYEGAEMLLGNRADGRCFYLSMTEQSTEGNVSIQRQGIRCVAGINCCDGEHYRKRARSSVAL
jgi:hypothetical protein